MPERVPTLDELAADPALALALDPASAAALLARAEGAASVLRVAAARSPNANGQRPEPEVWLDPAAVAAKLGISVKAVYARRSLPWSPSFGRKRRMAERDLDAYLRGRRCSPRARLT